VIVAQLAKQSIPTPEDTGSNPAIIIFHKKNICLRLIVEYKEKETGNAQVKT